MKVKLADLRRAANKLFDHLAESGHDAAYEQPSVFTIGQLSEDLQHLEKVASGQSPAIGYGLVWLSSLLRFIGAKLVA